VCGLVGIAGALGRDDEDVMKRMLMLDVFRGKHSTGLAGVRNNGDVKIAKVADHPFTLFEMDRFKDACSGYNSVAFLGHNRAATRGDVTGANAHPFQFGHIVGAHNGTLWHGCHKELNKLLDEEYPVDSQSIIAAIAEFGIEEVVKILDGSYALTYFNLEEGTMNFIRNKDRPLWWSASKDGKFIWWASEWPIIRGSVTSHPVKGEYRELFYNKDGHCFFGFDEDVHYSFDIDALKKGGGFPKPRVRKMEGKKPFLAHSSTGGHRTGVHWPPNQTGFHSTRTQNGSTTTSRGTKTGTSSDNRSVSQIIQHFDGTKDEPTAGRITRERFEDLAKHGCTFCDRQINWGDTGIAIYDEDDIILCPDHSPPGVSEGTIRIYLPNIAA